MKINQTKSKKTRIGKSLAESETRSLDRRTFVKLVPALGVAGLAAANLTLNATAQTPTPTPLPSPSPAPTPLRVTKEMLRHTEKLIGIELTDAQEAMALSNVNTNLERYETLRKIDIPLDTEPAIAFHPALPGKKFNSSAIKFKLSKVAAPQFKSVEDLAFATVPQLAELIRTKKVSPVELTKMYLARLDRYGKKLNCVVTLTKDLALAQATAAEAEIKRGK